MGTQASKSNRTYFDLLPIELKEILLIYIPLEASEICDKESTFTNACLSEDYWEKLYHEEFSSRRLKSPHNYLRAYLLARVLLETNAVPIDPEVKLYYMISEGWDRRVIPLLEKKQFEFNRFDL